MKKLYQALKLDKPIDGTFGIEIEVEGKNLKDVNNKWWKSEDDGSLRGYFPESRCEYVLKAPVAIEHVRPVLKTLAKALEGAEFDFSFRTSVHVHLNMQDFTWNQVLNTIYLYLLFEEPLVSFCGKERKGNRFCLRLQDAEGILDHLNILFRSDEKYLRYIEEDAIRYSSINIAALRKYGSLEFRAMRGNMDIDRISLWTEALHRLRSYAVKSDSPLAIHNRFAQIGAEGMFYEVFEEIADEFRIPKMVKEIQRSFSLSIELPYSYRLGLKEAAAGKVKAPKGLAFVDELVDLPAGGAFHANPVPGGFFGGAIPDVVVGDPARNAARRRLEEMAAEIARGQVRGVR